MKIYTKKGDKGTTGLFGGTRVSKDHIRLECYGTVDELNSWLGLIAGFCQEEDQNYLLTIQDYLFRIGSLLATDSDKLIKDLPKLPKNAVESLEQQIDQISEQLPEMRSFILPGGHESSAQAHIARCVCRRAERLVTSLNQSIELNSEILPFLNRLSDYLFILARKLLTDRNIKETKWNPS
ncbi:MAG: cob(I)yrinic acid a,c-diamide adenosyltransferase [Flavobacteriales bacterium]|nr:cob(I)yrinic acid a,c-diamide adenosyltransferase [Flavobacteriales bacterium]